jgi:elongation factor Ts
MISASVVKELRERTGAGMMDCKKALTESNGDIEKAVEILREKGLAAAAKKSGRIASEGLIATYVSEDKKVASIVEVNCETDFVSLNGDFVALAENAAKMAAKTNASDIETLVSEKYVGDENITLKDAVTALIAKLGENMNIRRFKKFEESSGMIQSYTHGGGRIGVLVQIKCDKINEVVEDVAKNLAMQVAAANPLFLDRTFVDQETLDKEREIYRVQALNEGKPEKIVDKMVEGRIQKYLKETCLVDQEWVRDPEFTISKYLAEKSKEIGSTIKVVDFVRFEKGEGLEKKEENFAEEVMNQMKK